MYYLTETGHPVKSNCPNKKWTLTDKTTYDTKCLEINSKSEADRLAAEEAAKPAQEYEAKIQDKLREIAIKELGKEVIE